jgi:hypothetical protein
MNRGPNFDEASTPLSVKPVDAADLAMLTRRIEAGTRTQQAGCRSTVAGCKPRVTIR